MAIRFGFIAGIIIVAIILIIFISYEINLTTLVSSCEAIDLDQYNPRPGDIIFCVAQN